jgi:hypothetical protein
MMSGATTKTTAEKTSSGRTTCCWVGNLVRATRAGLWTIEIDSNGVS